MLLHPIKAPLTPFLLTSFTLCSALVLPSATMAAPVDRFRSNNDTFHRIQDVLDTLFPEDALVPGLSATLGLGLGYSPEYLGASNHSLTAVPVIRLNYRNIVTLSGTALRWNSFQGDNWKIGLHGRYISGRGNEQSGILGGLDDVDSTIAIGPFVEYSLGHTKIGAEWRYAVSGSRGNELRLTASTGLYESKDKRYALQGAVGAVIGSTKSLRKNFGITPEEAVRSTSGLTAYRPGGGLYNLSLGVGGRYKLTESWGVGHFTEVERLLGDADDSPLVKAGSAWQFTGGVGFFYSF